MKLSNNAQIKYSIIIPVFNAQNCLVELHNRLNSVLQAQKIVYEIIFIDDDSKDESWKVLQKLKKQNNRLKIIRLMRNFGQHNAIICGFYHATGDLIITMDDDLQNPPEEILKLIEKSTQGFDVIYGKYIKKQHFFLRNWGSNLVQLIYKRVFNIKGKFSSFRLLTKPIVEGIMNYRGNYSFIDGLIAWQTNNIGYVDVAHNQREESTSGYTLRKLLGLSFNMITNFSIYPLQVASFLGITFFFIGLLMATFFIVKKIAFGTPVTGFTALITTVTIFSGVQLLTVGIIGEYLGRVHINANNMPQFRVREKETD